MQPDLDRLLHDEKGNLRVVPAALLRDLPRDQLLLHALRHAVYVYATEELVALLRTLLTGVAIEVGAGHGSIARALGIVATDSYMQTTPAMRLYYASIGQPVVEPPKDVHKFEALEAVDQFKPDTVMGAYVTQVYKAEDGNAQSSMFGIDEDVLVSKVHRYVVVGNERTHGLKRILRLPHRTIREPGIITRATYPEHNLIYVWG